MDDLISRSALLEQMHNHYEARNPKQNATMDECCMMVIHAPAVDAETVIKSLPYVKEALEMAKQTVAPVRHGRWDAKIMKDIGTYTVYWCSECNCYSYFKYNYCPNCGAKMDGGAADDQA